jgi:para-aminobenzoate synthetase / 4-amino-4-deoxychorismate lyase
VNDPSVLSTLATLRCRVVSEWLAPPSDPLAVLRAAGGSPGLVGLFGAWAESLTGLGAVIASDPLVVLDAPTDLRPALGTHPRVADPDPGVVGGGWFGVISYDGVSRLGYYDHLLRLRPDGWYFEALVSEKRDALLRVRREELEAVLDAALGLDPTALGWQVGEFEGASRLQHLAAVEQTIESIRAGEIYQANVCTRLRATFSGSTSALFAAAVNELRPAFASYVESDRSVIASLSPELFLRRRGREVQSSPIKGTAPGTPDGETRLRRSAKDAAENIMIVDLMRNDLGSVCEVGTVRVPQLLEVQPHAGVWHLISTVTGRLRESVDDAELLAATFPPGSVTGAPKHRAVELMRAVEGQARGAYTGAVGFSSPSWGAELNVAIRTFEFSDGAVELGVGGGVTADSVPMLEWRECLDKAAPLLASVGAELGAAVRTPVCEPTDEQLRGGVLETLLAVDGRVLRLADHLARLDRSVRELYGSGLPAGLAAEVVAAASGEQRAAVRVMWRDGEATVTVTPIGAGQGASRPSPSHAISVPRPGGLWRHKWADRAAFVAEEAALSPRTSDGVGSAPLYVAADGAVLETSRGSVFALGPDGSLVTPPLRDDLLPGVTRRALLDYARDTGRPHEVRELDVAELMTGAAFWTSSLSLAVPIHSVDGVPLPRQDELVAELALALLS